MAIYLVCQFFVYEDKIDAFKKAAVDVVQNTNREEGCIFYNLHQNQKKKDVFFMFEKWEKLENLEKHSNSAHVARFRKAVGGLFKKDKIISILSDDIFNVENDNIINSNSKSNKNNVYIFAQLTIADDKIDEFIGAALGTVKGTNNENGCLAYNLSQDTKNPNSFFFLERWSSFSALPSHQQQPHFKEFNRKIKQNRYAIAKPNLNIVSGPLIDLNNRSRL